MLRSRGAARGALEHNRAPGWNARSPRQLPLGRAGRALCPRLPHGPGYAHGGRSPFPIPAGRFRVAGRVPLEAAGRELRGGRRFPSSSSSSSSSPPSSRPGSGAARGRRGLSRVSGAGRARRGRPGKGRPRGPGAAVPAALRLPGLFLCQCRFIAPPSPPSPKNPP